MVATNDIRAPRKGNLSRSYGFPVLAGIVIYGGAAVALTAEGNAVPVGHANAVKFVGFAEERVDNRDGATGDQHVKAEKDVRRIPLAGATIANIGTSVYATADDTFTLTASTTDWAPDAVLQNLKSRLKAAIDVAAETERLKYITPGAGQAMTYQQKMEEVRALAQDGDPNPTHYPLLSAEIGITAPTLAEVAEIVLAAYQEWQQVGAAIEGARLAAKASIETARTLEDAAAAAVVEWPNT